MARPLNASPALHLSREIEYREIERWYVDMLDHTEPPAELQWEPVKVGPTWQSENGWTLPEATLGWGFLSWTGYWLNGKGGKPWTWTPEQTRFLLWYYAVDSAGDFLFHTGRLQRLKGWGKDPLAAGVSAGSLHAPIVFDLENMGKVMLITGLVVVYGYGCEAFFAWYRADPDEEVKVANRMGGPYAFLYYAKPTNSAMPVAPVMDMIDLHMSANKLWRKADRQAQRQKYVGVVGTTGEDDGRRVVQASDGQMIRLDDPNQVNPRPSTLEPRGLWLT